MNNVDKKTIIMLINVLQIRLRDKAVAWYMLGFEVVTVALGLAFWALLAFLWQLWIKVRSVNLNFAWDFLGMN